MTWATSMLLVILLVQANLFVSYSQLTVLVIEELKHFISTHVETAIEHYRRYNSETYEICFSSAAGRYLRHQCCVYFTNIAASQLFAKYGLTPSGNTILDSTVGILQPENFPLINVLMRTWAVENDSHSGIYTASLVVAGVQGTLIKCAFLDVHTYLVFTSPLIEDIIIDVSYFQFLLIPEHLSGVNFQQIEAVRPFDNLYPFFVGQERSLLRLFTTTQVIRRHLSLFGDGTLDKEARTDIQLKVPLLRSMFRKHVRLQMCGRRLNK
jgi:hypothetical protein